MLSVSSLSSRDLALRFNLPDILFPMPARANSIEKNSGQREIVDLRKISAQHLEPLLADEIHEWRSALHWDFEPSAELVRKYAGTNSLGGAALISIGELAGYGYAVLEEPRGIIGDLYVRPHLRDATAEAELFRSLLDALIATPRVNRMESQLMLMTPEAAAIIDNAAAPGRGVRLFERHLMSRAAGYPLPPGNAAVSSRFRFERWQDHMIHVAGSIIAGAYKGETDSEINAQYRSPAGARRFLSNIVEFPGCGNFHAPASFLAFSRDTGEPAGVVLASFVAGDTGHISQLCVMPQARGSGLGKELLRESVGVLYQQGARLVSLTVTASNGTAISIYDKFGFEAARRFFAYIWEA
jgi:ribosomal protein S18 acetylase RimI-like enzyme